MSEERQATGNWQLVRKVRRSRLLSAMPEGMRIPRGSPLPSYQRGVALITAVLIVALATMLAVEVGFKGYLDQRRSITSFALDQGFEMALGAEAWAADILRTDKVESAQTDDFTETWATPIPPIPVEGGQVEGQLEDMQGRFNLNSLVRFENNRYVVHKPAVERLTRLLELLQMEDKWAPIIADFIDSDTQEEFPNGAEDSTYTSLTPAYRPPNMPLTRASELLAIAGFGLERYQKLEPFVTALPIGTTINLCTAPLEVLDSLVAGNVEYSQSRETNADLRKQRCFPSKKDFQGVMSRLSADDKQELDAAIGETSDYFRASVWVTIGTTQFTLYSLLYRTNGTNQVRPILRSFGTT